MLGAVSGRLVIIGSGENAPGMIKLHRTLLEPLRSGRKTMLDTPFGFQVNADDLTSKYQQYFEESVGQAVEVGRWRRRDDAVLDRERTLALIAESDWVFAAPGSPSYALHHWQDTQVPTALAQVLSRGGTLVIGSAAAATLGSHTVPVYEIYKVGLDPYWLPGLDLLGDAAGIRAAVVPHFDNREGGRHDTSCCYIGLERLTALEAVLPADTGVIGVDEHTAAVLDLVTDEVSVHGPGGLTLRADGAIEFHAGGTSTTLTHLREFLNRGTPAAVMPRPSATELEATVQFAACIKAGDSDGAAALALELEDELFASPSADAHLAMRSMLVQLADSARAGMTDTHSVIAPFVEILLEIRRIAREGKDYAMSDLVRDALASAGVEVRDTPEGMVWDTADPR